MVQKYDLRKLPISDLMLQEKALQFSKDLGKKFKKEFKVSDSWLESFRKFNNIAFCVKTDKKADTDELLLKIGKNNFQPL